MVPGEMVCRPRIPRVNRFPATGGRKKERRAPKAQRVSSFSLSLSFACERSFRQQSCRFWTPISLHSSLPALVLASPGKFRFYFASFAVISSLFHGSWYCLSWGLHAALGNSSDCCSGLFSSPRPLAAHNFIFFLRDNGNALIVVPCCVYGKFNCLNFMHMLCFAAAACLRGARSCSPVM